LNFDAVNKIQNAKFSCGSRE